MNNSESTLNNEATSTDETTPNIQYTPSTPIEGVNSIENGKFEFPPIRQLNENQVKSCRPHDSAQDDMHSAAYADHIAMTLG